MLVLNFVVLFHCVLLSLIYTVTVEPESATVQVRECDDLVLKLTTSGTYRKPYQVTVVCVPFTTGGGGKLWRVHVLTAVCPIHL